MRILGIDNGYDGALVCISGKSVAKTIMPAITVKDSKREYDVNAIVKFITLAAPDHVFVERAQAMPGQGVSSMFSIGKGYGIMLGILAALQVQHTIVHPKTWQKTMFRDCPKSDTKAMSAIVCKRLFPQFDWKASERCKNVHDGLTDAALIAEYGRRQLAGNDTEF